MPSIRHVHTYVRLNKTQFKCDDPYCSHIQSKDRLFGKATRCSICKNTEFVLTREDLKRSKPRCINCSETKAAKNYRETREDFGKILADFDSVTVPKDK
jgi:hypothetical protein